MRFCQQEQIKISWKKGSFQMRRINVETITQNIKEMCIEANHFLSPDMKKVFDEAAASEESPLGRQIFICSC